MIISKINVNLYSKNSNFNHNISSRSMMINKVNLYMFSSCGPSSRIRSPFPIQWCQNDCAIPSMGRMYSSPANSFCGLLYHWKRLTLRVRNPMYIPSALVGLCAENPEPRGNDAVLMICLFWVNIWGVLCQKGVSKAGTSNYIPQIPLDVIIYPYHWYLLLVQHLLKSGAEGGIFQENQVNTIAENAPDPCIAISQ